MCQFLVNIVPTITTERFKNLKNYFKAVARDTIQGKEGEKERKRERETENERLIFVFLLLYNLETQLSSAASQLTGQTGNYSQQKSASLCHRAEQA